MSLNYKILLTFLLALTTFVATASPLDSLRTEKIKGQKFIIHRVEPQETLFSISRKYNLPVDEIRKYNPEVNEGLKMYAEIKIPFGEKKGLFSRNREDEKTPSSDTNSPNQFHVVEAGETLFAISRKYGIPVDSLRKVNQMVGNEIGIGDTLWIQNVTSTTPETTNQNIPTKSTKANNENYHIVASSETLYSISRKHEISLDSLRRFNDMTTDNIGIGDTLWLGSIAKEISTEEHPKAVMDSTTIEEGLSTPIDSNRYHIVKASETLFAISKKYNLDLDSLVAWNNLSSYNLSIGQALLIESPQKPLQTTEQSKVDLSSIEKKDPQLDTIYVKTDNSPVKTTAKVNEEGKIEIKQEGFAMEIEDTDHTTKYLALHRDAPPGTLMRVINQMNGKEVDVRVVGGLPESGLNKNVMLRISHAAFLGLGALDYKIPVQASYIE